MKRIMAALTLMSLGIVAAASTAEFSMEKAKKVDTFLRRIGERDRQAVILKKMTFTERELNSYLNIFYIRRYAPEVKRIQLKLLRHNRVSGSLHIKLAGKKYEKVPSFLKDVEIEFAGKVECENYRMRYVFDQIRINGTTFAPEILDEAFYAAQTNFRLKKSIFDWFSLLPGLKNVVIDYKKITIYY